jgi:PqqD family protein of HPr-rel-A system
MQVLAVRRSILIEAVGEMWAAFSPASGETQLLNDEAAAILEVLSDAPRSMQDVASVMALESALPPHTLMPLLEDAAIELEAAGLIWSAATLEAGIRPAGDRVS